MKVNLKDIPFNLSSEDIKWIEKTKENLSLDEKIGQIFIDMLWRETEEDIEARIKRYNIGGFRYGNMSAEKIYQQNLKIQGSSKIPALIAANIEEGGNGGIAGGTYMGSHVAIGATNDSQNAYNMAYYGCTEAASVGCNWTFAPVVDINKNWRNSAVSNRCFSSDTDQVIEMSKAYLKGANDAGLLACMKHFPGDGCDERDQHIVTTINDRTYDEWMGSYGRVYKEMIDSGIQSIMIGHIQAPALSRKLCPGIEDEDIMPASIAPELLKNMLRGILNFNGLIITDATNMVGLTGKVRREDLVPGVIESGCDMILYYKNKDEDVNFIKEALSDGRLSQERFDDALTRVLAMKVLLKLHEKKEQGTLMPPSSSIELIRSEKHLKIAEDIADQSITLVKNIKPENLPLSNKKHKRILLYSVDTTETSERVRGNDHIPLVDLFEAELKAQGFVVDKPCLEPLLDGSKLINTQSTKDFKAKYDAAILVLNVGGFSQSNVRRISWAQPMGPDIPWYSTEIPTFCISFNNPFHLIDVPMVPVYINAYSSALCVVKQTIMKLMGRSEFKGVSPVDAFCNAWDTHL